MTQSGVVAILNLTIFGNILQSVAKNRTDIARSLGRDSLDKQIDEFNKEYTKGENL